MEKSTRENKVDWFRAIKEKELGQYFSSKLKIQKSPFGLGVFATSPIKPGEILIIERPLVSTGYSLQDPDSTFAVDISSMDLKQKM